MFRFGRLGNIRGVVDNNWPELAMLESRLYAPYGVPFGVQGTPQTPYGFTGEPTDVNALVYLRARYLNPGLGVFVSLDPVEGEIRRAMSLNGYNWVDGNVPNTVDPSGQQAGMGCSCTLGYVPVGDRCVAPDGSSYPCYPDEPLPGLGHDPWGSAIKGFFEDVGLFTLWTLNRASIVPQLLFKNPMITLQALYQYNSCSGSASFSDVGIPPYPGQKPEQLPRGAGWLTLLALIGAGLGLLLREYERQGPQVRPRARDEEDQRDIVLILGPGANFKGEVKPIVDNRSTNRVIAVDSDHDAITLLSHEARRAGYENRFELIEADYTETDILRGKGKGCAEEMFSIYPYPTTAKDNIYHATVNFLCSGGHIYVLTEHSYAFQDVYYRIIPLLLPRPQSRERVEPGAIERGYNPPGIGFTSMHQVGEVYDLWGQKRSYRVM